MYPKIVQQILWKSLKIIESLHSSQHSQSLHIRQKQDFFSLEFCAVLCWQLFQPRCVTSLKMKSKLIRHRDEKSCSESQISTLLRSALRLSSPPHETSKDKIIIVLKETRPPDGATTDNCRLQMRHVLFGF